MDFHEFYTHGPEYLMPHRHRSSSHITAAQLQTGSLLFEAHCQCIILSTNKVNGPGSKPLI